MAGTQATDHTIHNVKRFYLRQLALNGIWGGEEKEMILYGFS